MNIASESEMEMLIHRKQDAAKLLLEALDARGLPRDETGTVLDILDKVMELAAADYELIATLGIAIDAATNVQKAERAYRELRKTATKWREALTK